MLNQNLLNILSKTALFTFLLHRAVFVCIEKRKNYFKCVFKKSPNEPSAPACFFGPHGMDTKRSLAKISHVGA